MSKLVPVVVAAAFAAVSLSVAAQTKDDKKTEVKSAQGGGVKTQDKKAVTTATEKPKEPSKGIAFPKPDPKPKTQTGSTDVKSAQGGPVTTQDKKDVTTKSK
ncbi:MAG TPA: hypothetical protein VMU46_14230 [Burkholderiales bacterium]|nr:hypothetical protein [Burkholderiales bacterium]